MIEILGYGSCFIAGVVFAVWRIKGKKSVAETAKVVVMGGGGPGEEHPET